MALDLVKAVRDAGVVGAGGAGFPTHVKIAAQVDTVIANGAECDPLLQCDQRLMESRATEMVRGMSLLLMESRYPAGDEFVLVYEATGRLVPETGIPLDVGCLVQNVQTLFNIDRAAQGTAVTHRLLTVAGAVTHPVTLWAPIGSSLSDILVWAGGILPPRWSERTASDYAVVVGGPMMGRVADNLDEPVTKTTSGLIVLPRDNAVIRRGISTCDQCRDCTHLCPRYLLGHNLKPHEVMRAINYGLDQPADKVTAAVLCCECRLCEAYACPLELSPMAYYVSIKEQLRAQGWSNDMHKRTDFEPHIMREYRLAPTHRLIARLGLTEWEHQACPLDETDRQPARVTLCLDQHIGAPASPVVRKGDQVSTGQLIAQIQGTKLGANIHASIAGRIAKVGDDRIEIIA